MKNVLPLSPTHKWLLPQKGFHFATIHWVKASNSRDCASNQTVYQAHHSTLDFNRLYEQVHLYKAAIPTFARTLKDVTLNRSPSTSHRTLTDLQHPLPKDLHRENPHQEDLHPDHRFTSHNPTCCAKYCSVQSQQQDI